MLIHSGYSQTAVDYFINKPKMGTLPDADQVSELTGPCGDTMKIYLKMDNGRIEDARIQVLGCPGAVASAMVAMELITGKTIDEARQVKDGDVFRVLEALPEQKQHCIRLAIKTLQKGLDEFGEMKTKE
jgi:nitrogen fixation NifU-like protein